MFGTSSGRRRAVVELQPRRTAITTFVDDGDIVMQSGTCVVILDEGRLLCKEYPYSTMEALLLREDLMEA